MVDGSLPNTASWISSPSIRSSLRYCGIGGRAQLCSIFWRARRSTKPTIGDDSAIASGSALTEKRRRDRETVADMRLHRFRRGHPRDRVDKRLAAGRRDRRWHRQEEAPDRCGQGPAAQGRRCEIMYEPAPPSSPRRTQNAQRAWSSNRSSPLGDAGNARRAGSSPLWRCQAARRRQAPRM